MFFCIDRNLHDFPHYLTVENRYKGDLLKIESIFTYMFSIGG